MASKKTKKPAAKKAKSRSTTRSKVARKSTAKKSSTTKKKPAAKLTAKSSAQKTTKKKKSVSKKTTTSRQSTAKKSSARKSTAQKSTAKKSAAKKSVKKKSPTTARKSTARKTSSSKSTRKKSTQSTREPTGGTLAKGNTGPATEAATSPRKKAPTRKPRRSKSKEVQVPKADKDGYVFINGRRVRMISTGGYTKSRKTTKVDTVAGPDEIQQVPAAKLGKTKLKKRELDRYREMLLIKRAELVGNLSSLEAEALRSSGGNLSHMPIHMADIGSDTYEQDFMLGLAESERKLVREIDAALQRIQDRTYGVCRMTGKPIPKARLDAKPWAQYTIEAARQVESGRSL